jgi:hypothetical protein
MALWGITDTTDESKPKWLNTSSKVNNIDNCFADERGWIYRHYKNAAKTDYWDEVLVAVGNLATSLGGATITDLEFITTSVSAASPGTFSVRLRYNERVTVDTSGGTPTLVVTNSNAGTSTSANLTASYASGSNGYQLTFTGTWTNEFLEGDVLSIAAQNVALNSGTIVDRGTAVNSELAISAAAASAAGTITVAA